MIDANEVPPMPDDDEMPPNGAGMMDFYVVLGVRASASTDDIKAAYRRLARELHPDVNSDPDAAKRFRDIKEAYDTLSNPAKRKQYDANLAAARAANSGDGGAGFTGPPPPSDPPHFKRADEYPPPTSPFDVAQKLYKDHALGDRMTHLWSHRGNWMAWKTTCWVEIDEAELKQALYSVLSTKWYWRVTAKTEEPCEWSPNKHKVADVIEALAAVTHLSARIDPPAWTGPLHSAMTTPAAQMISCKNGLFDLSNRTLVEHTPDLYNLVSVPLDYDPDAPDPEEWLRFLQSLWGDDEDSINLLQEYFGYVLSGRLEQQKMLLLIGPIRSGKGTIARTLTALMGGKDNIAGPTLAQLGTNFGLASLLGKPLAIISDARLGDTPSYIVVERLLTITGEDTLDVDRKFRDQWTGKLPTRLVMLSNELPKFRDASGAIATRMLILRMVETFLNREDKNLDKKLAPELPGILLWALQGLDRLNKNGKFTVPKSSDDAAVLMMDIASPMSAFVRERCVTKLERRKDGTWKHGIDELCVSRDDLFAAWRVWAEDKGHHGSAKSAKSTFGRDLRAVVPRITDNRKRVNVDTGYGIRSKQIHTYAGIALLPDSLDSDDEYAGQGDIYPDSKSAHPDSDLDSDPFAAPRSPNGQHPESGHPGSGTSNGEVKPQVNGNESSESGKPPIASPSKKPNPGPFRFTPPIGPGRCPDCGWHPSIQGGHAPGCPGKTSANK
jgi:putative DNA primase/helicase